MNIIKLDKTKSLIKPPVSKKLKSGFVVLKKGEEIGWHSTENKEEMVVVIKGKATLLINNSSHQIISGNVVYIPPNTGHNVKNNYTSDLKYIYITTSII